MFFYTIPVAVMSCTYVVLYACWYQQGAKGLIGPPGSPGAPGRAGNPVSLQLGNPVTPHTSTCFIQ